MPSFILYEYEIIKDKAISFFIKNHKELHPYFKEEWGEIKPLHYCGVINMDGQNIFILPKITTRNQETNLHIFTYMLLCAYDIKLYHQDRAFALNHKSDLFLEVLVQHFSKELLQEFTKGLYKTYITQEENLRTLRGKYLITQNIRHNFTKSKIYCEFDEFSVDNELNQFFLFALQMFLPHVKQKKYLKECLLALDGVSQQTFDAKSIKLHFHKLNSRYKPSYEFAVMLLQRYIPLFANGEKSFAFLFDMNELFEHFIGKIYQQIDATTQLQKQKNYGSLVLKPDILTRNMIIDTKYKKLSSREELRVGDKYQMFVYGINLGIVNTMLLYPKHQENVWDDLELGKGENIVHLKMRSIDLDCDGEYEEFLDEIRERVGKIDE